jgi:hypothetical protein
MKKVLFYFFKNVHISIFEPVIRLLEGEAELYFAAPAHNPQAREGLTDEEKQYISTLAPTARWLNHQNELACDVAVIADCVAPQLSGHGCVVNLGHGLISKGQYYGPSPLIGRENQADVICVPGPWHKRALENLIHIPIEVTGMSKLDTLFGEFDRSAFMRSKGLDPTQKLILWAPTFNMELSGIPVLWSRIRELTSLGQVVMKLHGTTDIFFKNHYRQLAAQTPGLFYVEEADGTPYMRAADLMISDVSSVVFEFTALNKPLVLVDNPHQRDYVNYNENDVEYTMRQIGARISHPEQLLPAVEHQLANPDMYAEQRQLCAQEMFAAHDGQNSTRIKQVILDYAAEDYNSRFRWSVAWSEQAHIPDANQWPIWMKEAQMIWAPAAQREKIQAMGLQTVRFYETPADIQNRMAKEEFLVVLQRPAQMVSPWEKYTFGPLKFAEVSVAAPLTSNEQAQSYGDRFLKRQNYQLPAKLDLGQLAQYLRFTNPGERQPVSSLDAPLCATKAETLSELSQLAELFTARSNADNGLNRFLLSDTIVVE